MPGPIPAPSPPQDIDSIPDAVPRAEPRSRRGNPPFYEVFGKRYFVLPGSEGYVERGVASWYDFAVAIAEEGARRKLAPEQVQVKPITTEEFPTAARRPRMSLLDCSLTVAATGAPRLHWRTWLRRTLDEVVRA